ncbi:hypothetical protein [Christiangramia sabulilitoris]|uniref:Uncharacterized protein n=1 Tax=Christiangramia sabulilitoris TaxID=2583991 RepID=A0A550I7I9_9FLAO|nr:hypothetical protein [Christiangramia sabulilitoris]TRO66939.1 hypothetical protein FGM01_03350 [Christiangramia sabulilitoris]
MIPMRKTSHTWFLLAILFMLDYSDIRMEIEPPLPKITAQNKSYTECIDIENNCLNGTSINFEKRKIADNFQNATN